MKRLIVTVFFAAVAFPVIAADDRLPYDQSLVDRALPDLRMAERLPVPSLEVAAAGNTRSDVEISTEQVAKASSLASGAWANDHHFIAPAQ